MPHRLSLALALVLSSCVGPGARVTDSAQDLGATVRKPAGDASAENVAASAGATSGGASAAESRLVSIEMRYRVEAPGDTTRARILLLVPTTLPGRQDVLRREWILPPTHTYERTGGLEAEWIFDEPKGSFDLGCVLTLELHPCDLTRPPGSHETDPVLLDTYLRDEAFIEKHSPRIARAARELAPFDTQGLDLLRALFNGALFELENHGFKRAERGANRALKMGGGDCTDFADVLTALCRARGLPARHIRGFLARPFGPEDTPKHSWSEVHLDTHGWLRLDPFFTKLGHATFSVLPNDYIQVSCDRNEEVQNFWRYWYWGDPISVTETLNLGHGIWTETVSSLPKN